MRARLAQIENGTVVSTTILRGGTLVIGRDASADLVLLYRGISRHHVTVEAGLNGHRLRDLTSTNGTRVNGELVNEPVLLQPGDVIRLGDELTLVYEYDEPVPPRVEPSLPDDPAPLERSLGRGRRIGFALLALGLVALAACWMTGWISLG